MAEPWQCPACLAWIAPHVTEHRCDGDGGVPVDPVGGLPPMPTWPLGGVAATSISAVPQTVHVHVSGALGDAAFVDMVRQVRRGLSGYGPPRRYRSPDSDAE